MVDDFTTLCDHLVTVCTPCISGVVSACITHFCMLVACSLNRASFFLLTAGTASYFSSISCTGGSCFYLPLAKIMAKGIYGFCFCAIANFNMVLSIICMDTGIGLYPRLCTCRLCCDLTVIPFVVYCVILCFFSISAIVDIFYNTAVFTLFFYRSRSVAVSGFILYSLIPVMAFCRGSFCLCVSTDIFSIGFIRRVICCIANSHLPRIHADVGFFPGLGTGGCIRDQEQVVIKLIITAIWLKFGCCTVFTLECDTAFESTSAPAYSGVGYFIFVVVIVVSFRNLFCDNRIFQTIFIFTIFTRKFTNTFLCTCRLFCYFTLFRIEMVSFVGDAFFFVCMASGVGAVPDAVAVYCAKCILRVSVFFPIMGAIAIRVIIAIIIHLNVFTLI